MKPLKNAKHQPLYQDQLGVKHRNYFAENKPRNEAAKAKYEALIDFARKYFASPALQTDFTRELERLLKVGPG
jgi:hypothetical protein